MGIPPERANGMANLTNIDAEGYPSMDKHPIQGVAKERR